MGKDILKLVTHVELLAPFIPAYEVKLVSSAEIPRVNILRNKEQLLQQALEVILNGQVEFGRVNEAKDFIKMKTLMVKTEQQKESVRTEMVIPAFLRRLPVFDLIVPNIANVVKTLFVGHLIETPISHVSPTDVKIITKVSRV